MPAAQAFAERGAGSAQGQGQLTGVDGENIVFGPATWWLTPKRHWHNHGTVGKRAGAESLGAATCRWSRPSAPPFDHNYGEEVNGVYGAMKQQTSAFVPDYSQRIYGYGGMLPRFGNKEKRGAGLLIADVRLSWI